MLQNEGTKLFNTYSNFVNYTMTQYQETLDENQTK